MLEHYVLTPPKRGRKPKVKETPNYGAVRTESIKKTIVTEPEAEFKAKPADEVSPAPEAEIQESKAPGAEVPAPEPEIQEAKAPEAEEPDALPQAKAPEPEIQEAKAPVTEEPDALPQAKAPEPEIQEAKAPVAEVPAPEPGIQEAKAPATGMRRHPLNIAPDANDEQYEHVKQSMKNRGFDVHFPIDVTSDGTFTGKSENYQLIIDGMTRYRACMELGIIPVYRHVKGTDKEILDLCMNSNSRKVYTNDQWSCIVTEYKKLNAVILEAEAKERMASGGKKKGSIEKDNLKKGKGIRTTDKVIQALGAQTNKDKVAKTDKLIDENPDAYNDVKNDKKSLKEVLAEKENKAAENEKIQRERDGIPAKPKPIDANALYSMPIKDAAKKLNAARRKVEKLEEKLAPAVQETDDYIAAHKSDTEDVDVVIAEQNRLQKIEDDIDKDIDKIKMILIVELFDKKITVSM